MPTLWIREYEAADRVPGMPLPQEPGTDQAPIDLDASPIAQSAAFGASTYFIAFVSDVAIHYVIGTSPAATSGALYLAAKTMMTVELAPTPGMKLHAIPAE